MGRYTVVLLQNPAEQVYTVLVPELPGCVTEGDTVEEALANARDAIAGHLEALAVIGEEIPIEIDPPIIATVDVDRVTANAGAEGVGTER